MLVFFDSEVLNLKCYAGPLTLDHTVYQKHFSPEALPIIWMDLQILTLTTGE